MNLGHELVSCPWRRLINLIVHLPRHSNLMLERVGEVAMWGPAENMLAATVDLLQAGNWQRSGGKGSRPKPWPRPGVTDPTVKRFGDQKLTIEQWHERKARRRHRLGGGEPLSPSSSLPAT